MKFFRSLLFSTGMILATIVYAPLSLLTFPLPLAWRYHFITSWSHFIIWWLKITCQIDYRIKGRENIPSKAAIIMSKHQSTWETLILQMIFPQQVWILKRELLMVPFFGWGLAMLKPIAIDRKGGRKAVEQLLEQGRAHLRAGRWIVVFPEGTRVPPGKKGRYALGGAILAEQTGTVIVPVAHNSGYCWRKKQFIKQPGTITVSIGPIIDPSGKTANEIIRQVENWIETEVKNIGPA
ncbi:MAG: 1-acyl-sn-glycerol-3-phosphate acyltransferase [Gammaproteobacteria bacterium]|nr:MAG: 1-acyl-sn-glycerol-3-phosphate acyltransferase [Gammaproteobacteria bacterium]